MFSLTPCPASGAGVHYWLLASANRCHRARLPQAEASRLIAGRMTRRPTPADEVETAIAKAYSGERLPSGTACRNLRFSRAPVPLTEIKFDPAKLASVAGRITAPKNWRHWLWERSAKRPEAMDPWAFLLHLYRPGEIVLVFDQLEAKEPLQKLAITSPMDCRVPQLICDGGRWGKGIWFLSNPVDGEWHDTGAKDAHGNPAKSCRNQQAVTTWRYAVLESDQAPAALWIAFLVQLPVRIAAIYTSGSRSIHALIRLDAASKADWDSIIAPLKRPLKVLGVDSGALSAVRLSRLPGCRRPEKGGFQRLLYLCQNPPAVPLVDLPARFPRSAYLSSGKAIP